MCNLDCTIINLNWKIAHGVQYTGACLFYNFHLANVSPLCFCGADDETLEHLFFECEVAHFLVAWVFSHLQSIHPTASRFTVDELLFGFSDVRRRMIPSVIIFILLVMKHIIWVAECDFRFRQKKPVIRECLQKPIIKLEFFLCLLSRWCKATAQICTFELEWLAQGTLGHFEGTKLVFL